MKSIKEKKYNLVFYHIQKDEKTKSIKAIIKGNSSFIQGFNPIFSQQKIDLKNRKIYSFFGYPLSDLDFNLETSEIVRRYGKIFFIYNDVRNKVIPDSIHPMGDDLYFVYRKGLISRHICKNGRLYETIALENIDPIPTGNEFEIVHSSGYGFKYDLKEDQDLRYQIDFCEKDPEIKPYLWVPIIAPIKYPGYTKGSYFLLAGAGDNPMYFGGMALATLMLEHKYGVSLYSIFHARTMVQFFLNSEMNGQNGFIVRRSKEFNTGYNVYGEPYLRGASQEELLGFFLGLMYYLRYEDEEFKQEALYKRAKDLRDRVLEIVSSVSPYKHQFMLTAQSKEEHNERYWVKIFRYAYHASRDRNPLDHIPPHAKSNYRGHLRSRNGASRPSGWAYWEYSLDLISIILILDGALPLSEKIEWAEWYIKHVLRPSLTAGRDTETLKTNCFWGVMTIWCTKYLEKSSEWNLQEKLNELWEEDIGIYNDIVALARKVIFNANKPDNPLIWQHNLPLLKKKETDEKDDIWKNHNQDNFIGRWFVWNYKNYLWEKLNNWWGTLPGWGAVHDLIDPNQEINERQYLYGCEKYYSWISYSDKELEEFRRRDNLQIEGAGLGLTLLRILLTRIDNEVYPKPTRPWSEDCMIVQKYKGTEPYIFKGFNCKWSKDQYYNFPKFKINGSHDKSLRILSVPQINQEEESDLFTIHKNEDNLLILSSWSILDDRGYSSPKISLNNQFRLTKFDHAEMEYTTDDQDNKVIVLVDRAKDSIKHGLRISLFKTIYDNISLVGSWNGPRKVFHVKNLDMKMLNRKIFAVVYRNSGELNVLRLFKINFLNNTISELSMRGSGEYEETEEHSLHVATAYGNVIITSECKKDSRSLKIISRKYTEEEFFKVGSSFTFIGSEILDLAVTSYRDSSWLIVAYKKGDHEDLYLRSFQISKEGAILHRGLFNGRKGDILYVGRISGIERLSIEPVDFKDRPGFAISAKANALHLLQEDGSYETSRKGLKVLYGYITYDGFPTIQGVNVVGSGKDSDVKMCDVTSRYNAGLSSGIVTAHKTDDNYLQLIYWEFEEEEGYLHDFKRSIFH